MANVPTDFCNATTIGRGDRSYVSFGGCNYLGLAHHPRVIEAVREAAPVYGLSSSASRETTGNARPHALLERRITDFCAHESGLLVPDGYTANLAATQGLEQLGVKHALIDERAHASLKDAAKLAQMSVTLFDHLDAVHAAQRLSQMSGPCAVMTDSVFTTDGGLAPAQALLDVLRPDDWLVLDDCHGFGVLGRQGRGTPDELGLESEHLIVTTTLAKGLGCAGGMVMGPEMAVGASRAHSIAYRCTTPASPPLVAGGLAALDILMNDGRIHPRLRGNIDRVREILRSLGIPAHDLASAIFAFVLGDVERMQRIERDMLDAGVILPLMAYPNGPAPMYFRLTVNPEHTREQLELLREALGAAMERTHQAGHGTNEPNQEASLWR